MNDESLSAVKENGPVMDADALNVYVPVPPVPLPPGIIVPIEAPVSLRFTLNPVVNAPFVTDVTESVVPLAEPVNMHPELV